MSRFLRRLAAPLMFLLALPPAAGAECFGMNILDIMPAAERQAEREMA